MKYNYCLVMREDGKIVSVSTNEEIKAPCKFLLNRKLHNANEILNKIFKGKVEVVSGELQEYNFELKVYEKEKLISSLPNREKFLNREIMEYIVSTRVERMKNETILKILGVTNIEICWL